MAETNEPVPSKDPQAATLPSEEPLRTPSPGGPVAATDPDPRLATHAAQLATLSSGLAAQRVHLRDLENALVERIADVDDDRRLTGVQLQRALQSAREELDARLQRYGRMGAIALLLIVALLAVGLFATSRGSRSDQEALGAQVTALQQTLDLDRDRLTGIASQDDLVKEKLASLSAAVGALSQLKQLGEQQGRESSPTGSAPESTLAARIEGIASEQARLAGELESLRRDLAARPGPPPVPTDPAVPPADPPAPTGPAIPPADPPAPTGPAVPTADPPAPTGPAVPPADPPAEPDPGQAPGPATPPAATVPASDPVPAQSGTGEPAPVAATVAVADRRFALQIMSTSRREHIEAMAARLDLPAQAYIFGSTRRGRPWFALIHSLYSSRAQAQAALARLPPALAAAKPWIRELPADATLEPLAAGNRR